MKVFRQIEEIDRDPNTVLTIGTFDGLHLGHQKILDTLFVRSRFHGGRNFLITFHPHPRKVLSTNDRLKILSTPEEKINVLQKLGLENLLVINFSKEFSLLPPMDFVKNILIEKIGLKEIIIGHDHKFGKGRGGTYETLKSLSIEFGFMLTVVDEYKINDETISSTKIRRALEDGNVKYATALLGRAYSFSGLVVEGDKRGRTLGYPTANIKLDDENKLLPALGIYVVHVVLENQVFNGLLSIGKRPTFYENGAIIPEVNIFDFDRNIYGKSITIRILEQIRKEQKFDSAQELINQMNIDKETGARIFNEINTSEILSKFDK